VAFFGDGAMGQGVVYECLNMSAIWKLPLVFVCENNLYAESTPAEYALGSTELAPRAAPFGVPACAVDGQDVLAVYDEMGQAVERARAGGGPTFLECKTYRYHGHYLGDDPRRYRTAEEEAHYRSRDCIERFAERSSMPADELRAIDEEAVRAVDAAVAFAERSAPPALSELTTDVYSNGPSPLAGEEGRPGTQPPQGLGGRPGGGVAQKARDETAGLVAHLEPPSGRWGGHLPREGGGATAAPGHEFAPMTTRRLLPSAGSGPGRPR
jgi:TPP-dependent pyruvate/acetoin dehydrogenase alpha subunit